MVDHQDYHGAQSGPHLEDLPATCKECGGGCSPFEQRICLAELDREPVTGDGYGVGCLD